MKIELALGKTYVDLQSKMDFKAGEVHDLEKSLALRLLNEDDNGIPYFRLAKQAAPDDAAALQQSRGGGGKRGPKPKVKVEVPPVTEAEEGETDSADPTN